MLERAVALDPAYYNPKKKKEVAQCVQDFEDFVKMHLGHFGLND